MFLISVEAVGFSVHGEKGFAREPVGHLFQALLVLDEHRSGEKGWIHGAIIPVSGRYRSEIGDWAIDDVDGTYHFPSGSDFHHSGPGKDYSDGVNSQLIQLNEIGDFGCRESESVLSYAARKT